MRIALVCIAALLAACTSVGPDPAPATPQRPTLSSDTNTTAQGTFEVEAGATIDPSDSLATPAALKWGASERTELFVGLSPWVQIERPGGDLSGTSDLSVGVRHRFLDEDGGTPSAALQLASKLPTANSEVGTGEYDVFAAGIVTKGLGDVTATGFYQLGVLGDPTGSGTDLQHDLALAAGVPLGPRFGAFGELAGTFVPDQDVDAVFTTTGITYAPVPSLVFDLGVVVGFTEDAPDFAVVFGLTNNLGDVVRAFR